MLRSSRKLSSVVFANQIARIGFLIFVFAFLWARSACAQTVATYSFEDATADGWTSFNGASTPVATNAAAYSGSYSLLTTTNSGGAGGPSISLNGVLQAGATYTITGYVMLTSGESATNANFTIKRSDPSCSGGTCYDTVGTYQVPVSGSGWAQIGGSYTVSTTETGLVLYAQLVGATTAQSFYLDEVVITETAPPPGGTPIATYTFSDGGLDGWTPFGSASLANSVPPIVDPNGDARSLLVTNRTAGYMGPSLNLLSVNNVVAGATYQITAYVLLAAPDSSNPTATLSTKTTNCANTSGSYSNLATSGALSSTAWTKVQGTLSFSNLPGPPSSLVLYIQSSSATDSFYIDDVTVGELSPPPPSLSQQDNSGISTTFEDGGLDGWSSRTGSSTLTNTTAEAHSGTHSLLVTGRVANYDGPQISVNDKMYVGSVYNASVWVMLQPTDGSNHILNMSLQTALDGNTSYPSMTAYPGVTIPADGTWHQISVMRYNMANNYDPGAAYLYLQTVPASGNDLVSFYVDDFQLTYVPPPTIQPNLASIFQTLAPFFRVGAEVDLTDLSGPHNQLLTKHFDSITSGNDMKWGSVEASLGTYTYENADSEVGMAVCNEMHVRGHNLVWSTGEQTPAYATGDGTNSAANQATVTANIQEHIQSEVQHFGTAVYAWDVVNEPIDPTQPDCLYHGPFYQVLGKGYIDVALQAARQYAPAGTELFINDYSTTDPDRLACLVRVIRDLRERGVPLDGLGHEMHNDINYPSADAVVHAIDTIHENFRDLDQQVTEMDVSVYNAGDDTSNYAPTVPPSLIAEQGWLYKRYFDALRRLRGKISAVTFWGFADDDTWLDSFPIDRLDAPLPFDTELQAKPAYWGIVDPTQLPGYGLSFSVSDDKGTQHDTREFIVTATNGDVGIAYATQINGFTLQQFGGERCRPVVTPPSGYPIVLGDLAVGGTASATFTISFDHCGDFADFVLSVPWTSATYDTGTFVSVIHHRREHDHGKF
jgi:endo-1,4-beta-xylanase